MANNTDSIPFYMKLFDIVKARQTSFQQQQPTIIQREDALATIPNYPSITTPASLLAKTGERDYEGFLLLYYELAPFFDKHIFSDYPKSTTVEYKKHLDT
jgi:hypothetical protein